MPSAIAAAEWRVAHWLNAKSPPSLAALRGRTIMLLAFQILCPGCVSLAIPQARRARAAFAEDDLAVVGLHTVFEHHDAQDERALAAFLRDNPVGFSVGVDAPAADGGIPETMRAYAMQGTPTTILIDRAGVRRFQKFGHVDDLALGAAIGALLAESGRRAS